MFKSVSRSNTPRAFDPAMLCRKNTSLVEVLPILPAEATWEIKLSDDYDHKDFGEKLLFCLGPAIVIVAGLLAFIAPLPK